MRLSKTQAYFLVIILVLQVFILDGCKGQSDKGSEVSPVYDDYSTYAFFGTDSRAAGDDWKTDDSTGTQGAPSSDVIMILTVNNDSGAAKIISVYRDTMLNVAGDDTDFEKCNTAFRDGGAYGAIDMLERNLDIHIDGYATANFMSVADAIDMLGGVDVDIEDEKTYEVVSDEYGLDNVVDTMNKYIDEMNSVYDLDTPHIEKAGKQTVTGIQAVAYSRVRYTEGSDRRRTERQRNVVMLMAQKLRASDTETQNKVLKEMYNKIDTDLTESELMNLLNAIIDYDIDTVGGFPFDMNDIEDAEKGVLLVPCDLSTNVTELHKYLYGNDSYMPSKTVEEYSELITKETGMTSEDAK